MYSLWRLLNLACCILLWITNAEVVFAKNNQVYYKQFQEIFERVDRDYVEEPEVHKQKMIDDAINGMLNSLDPHSAYYTEEDLDDFITQTKGEFGGIGVEVMYDNGAIKVISPIDDLPADKAGIKAGDYIVGVNDEVVSNLGFIKAVKEMKGEPGTKVKLLVIKEDEVKPQEIELTRAIVKIKPIKAHLEEGDVAYIRIVTFNENTALELKKTFKTLSEASVNGVKGIILDLRNNPGGLLDQAVAVAEYFIESGVIVNTKGRNESSVNTLSANKFADKISSHIPVVILINNGSASAAEIVAGALQDHKRALIVGTKSFGKGSVQTFVQVSPRAAMKLTTARYYTPNGRSIQAEGIEPDIVFEQAKVEYPEGKGTDKRFSEASLKNYLKNDGNYKIKNEKTGTAALQKKGVDKDKKSVKEKNYEKISVTPSVSSALYKKDYQFARAYDLIRGLILNVKKQ